MKMQRIIRILTVMILGAILFFQIDTAQAAGSPNVAQCTSASSSSQCSACVTQCFNAKKVQGCFNAAKSAGQRCNCHDGTFSHPACMGPDALVFLSGYYLRVDLPKDSEMPEVAPTIPKTLSCADKIKEINPTYDVSQRLTRSDGALWVGIGVVCRDCGDCEVRDMLLVLRNVILFIVAGSGAFGVVIFIYGAFMMALSRGDSSRVSKAKEIMVSTIIAFIVVVCAWLIVNTVIGVITGGENLFPTDRDGFSWFRINPN